MAKKKPNKGNRPNNGQNPNPSKGNRNVGGNRPAMQKRPSGSDPALRGQRPSGNRPNGNNVRPTDAASSGEKRSDWRDMVSEEKITVRPDMPQISRVRPNQENVKPQYRPDSDKIQQIPVRDRMPRKVESKGKRGELEQFDDTKTQTTPAFVDEMADSDEVRRSHMAKKRKRDALKASFNVFLSIAILIGVLCIAVLYVVDYVAVKPKYAFVTEGTIEHTIGAKALILRDEHVTLSTHSGTLLSQATEGSRVSMDQVLAMVIPEGMESTLTELRNVERQIVDIERELMAKGKGEGAKAIFDEINAEISPIISTVRKDTILGNLTNMNSYSSSIRVLMETRDTNIESIDFDDEQLLVLQRTQQALKSQLQSKAATVKAEMSGIVSYKLDGHENDVDLSQLMSMMDYQFTDLLKKCGSIISGDLSVKEKEPVLRIVQNDVQYLACTVKGATLSDFQLESEHVIRIPAEGISISGCRVIRASYAEEGLFVLFETNNQVERLLDRRTVDIEIVQKKSKEQSKGLKVPVSSLVNPDYDRGVASIYVNESGYARSYTVLVIDHDREYAIIAPVDEQSVPSISTIVITNPSTVKVGDKVEK
ncbi:MAG: hypothetical protein J5752_04045 [Clostridiales bacterium]|nr:hypothetical protein [Clostridiales bacterium]